MNNLERLFKPKSVAIVGVSESTEKIGHVVFKNLVDSGFAGEIFLVNPKYEQIEGTKCYPSIEAIENEIDVACIVVPKEFVKDIVISSVKKNVKNVIIISAGYSEIGEEGIKLENELKEIIKGSNTRIIGPNCLGIIAPKTNISFAASTPADGNIAFLSQSGALCTALLDMAASDNLGFSAFVSMGNKIDIKENDFLEHFLNEPNTSVISAYIEEISEDINLLKKYSLSTTPKPFIIFKPGTSKQARSAMLLHTGSVADDQRVYETAIKQYGIINTNSVEDMYNLMKAFSWGKEIKGNRIAIVTNAGGPGIIATDAIVEHGLKLATISPETLEKLKSSLPPLCNPKNPIDILGDAKSDRYKIALEILSQDPNIDVIVVLLTPQYVTEIEETTKLIIELNKQTQKPIIPIYLGGKFLKESLEKFSIAKIPSYKGINKALNVVKSMYEFSKYKYGKHISVYSQVNFNLKGKYINDVKALATNTPQSLPDEIVTEMMEEIGINQPPQLFCKTFDEALSFAKGNYPVVLKAPNSAIIHKTDLKALYTNITNETQLNEAYTQLVATIKENIRVEPENVLIQKQLSTKEELILGVKRDGSSNVYTDCKGFGHLIMFGKGGIYSEIYDDFAFRLVPFGYDEITKMIYETKVSKILMGARGKGPLAISKLVETVVKLENLVFLYPEIESMDINPLFIDENNVYAIDVKINISI